MHGMEREKAEGQKGWVFWGNTKQVRVDFVEMGALISSFKSVHFQREKFISVGRKGMKNKRPSLVRRDVF